MLNSVVTALDKFGFNASTEALNVPKSLSVVGDALGTSSKNSSPPPPPLKAHEGACNYQSVMGQHGTLACTHLGCQEVIKTVQDPRPAGSVAAVPPLYSASNTNQALGDSQYNLPQFNSTPLKPHNQYSNVGGHLRGGLGKKMKNQNFRHQMNQNKQLKRQQKQQQQMNQQFDSQIILTGNQAYQYLNGQQLFQSSPMMTQQHVQSSPVMGQQLAQSSPMMQLQPSHPHVQPFQQSGSGSGNYLLNPSNTIPTSNGLLPPPGNLAGAGRGHQFHGHGKPS